MLQSVWEGLGPGPRQDPAHLCGPPDQGRQWRQLLLDWDHIDEVGWSPTWVHSDVSRTKTPAAPIGITLSSAASEGDHNDVAASRVSQWR